MANGWASVPITRSGTGLTGLKATAAEGKALTFAELLVLVYTDQLWFEPKRLFQRQNLQACGGQWLRVPVSYGTP